jgi:hypothetical protein
VGMPLPRPYSARGGRTLIALSPLSLSAAALFSNSLVGGSSQARFVTHREDTEIGHEAIDFGRPVPCRRQRGWVTVELVRGSRGGAGRGTPPRPMD